MYRKILIGLVIIILAMLAGCSSDAVTPGDQPLNSGPAVEKGASGYGHYLWGVYEWYIDPEDFTIDVRPARTSNPHFDVTSFVVPPNCLNCIKVVMTNFEPVTRLATFKVTLKNPTHLPGFDVRGILLDNGEGHVLYSPDGWTNVFDDGTPPEFNPFMRYAKTDPDGKFPPSGEIFEYYRIIIPKPPNFGAIQYVIDAFFPKLGSREPYEIKDIQISSYLWDDGSNTVDVSLRVLDRNNDVVAVSIECPQLLSGAKDMTFDGDKWTGEISNDNHAAASTTPYPLIFKAYDAISDYILLDKDRVYVVEKVYNWIGDYTIKQNGECGFEIAGVNGGIYNGGAFMADRDSGCNGLLSWDENFSVGTPALSLVDLNPLNSTLQPYPPDRFDSTEDGGLAFTNTAVGTFEDSGYFVDLNQVVITMDYDLVFKDDGAGNDQAHYLYEMTTMNIVDVCDGFKMRFYVMWAETTGDNLPVVHCYESPFTDDDQIIDTVIPVEFIGTEEDQIKNSATALRAIDVFETGSYPYSNVTLAVLENDYPLNSKVVIYNVYTHPDTGATEVTHIRTITINKNGGQPRDIEFLPPNPNYGPASNQVVIAVLMKTENGGKLYGYWSIYRLSDGKYIDGFGNAGQPTLTGDPMHMDVNNGTHTIMIATKRGPEFGDDNMWINWWSYE